MREASALNSTDVDEHVRATAVRRDEAEATRAVEELHDAILRIAEGRTRGTIAAAEATTAATVAAATEAAATAAAAAEATAAAAERLAILAEPNGVWRCRTIFNCTPACPREIEVTKAIGEVKLAIMRGSPEGIIKVTEIKEVVFSS